MTASWTVSAARLPSSENTSASCVLPTCRIVCSSTTRKTDSREVFPHHGLPFAECPTQLPGHDRVNIDVERDPYPKNVSEALTSTCPACVRGPDWCDNRSSQLLNPTTASMERRVFPQARREIEVCPSKINGSLPSLVRKHTSCIRFAFHCEIQPNARHRLWPPEFPCP